MKAAILTDTTKCTGCAECSLACKKVNHLPPDIPRRWHGTDGLGANNLTSIVRAANNTPVRKQCRHCLEPACVAACPVGAMHKTSIGAVVYDAAKCMGCRYCMMACPFGIPRYDWSSAAPTVHKCVLCYDRITKGGQPACTEACPTKASIFGDRDDLLAQARARIAGNPNVYLNKIWGEHDAGGTSVLYISNVDLSVLTGAHEVANAPVPALTEKVMRSVPFAFTGVLGAMAAVGWVIDRRMKIADEVKDEPDNREDEHDG